MRFIVTVCDRSSNDFHLEAAELIVSIISCGNGCFNVLENDNSSKPVYVGSCVLLIVENFSHQIYDRHFRVAQAGSFLCFLLTKNLQILI
jgi:hypothetical protein